VLHLPQYCCVGSAVLNTNECSEISNCQNSTKRTWWQEYSYLYIHRSFVQSKLAARKQEGIVCTTMVGTGEHGGRTLLCTLYTTDTLYPVDLDADVVFADVDDQYISKSAS
jgi:hypothetical protein